MGIFQRWTSVAGRLLKNVDSMMRNQRHRHPIFQHRLETLPVNLIVKIHRLWSTKVEIQRAGIPEGPLYYVNKLSTVVAIIYRLPREERSKLFRDFWLTETFIRKFYRSRMTAAQMQAQIYLNDKKIFELFNFLIGHLLVDEPTDPLEYLAELLDKCKLYRDGLCDPPLLFTPRHVESMFQSLDPGGLGSISMDQYKAGMTTLGIGCYDMNPKTCATGGVDKKTFEEEATKCLENMLSEMIGKKL